MASLDRSQGTFLNPGQVASAGGVQRTERASRGPKLSDLPKRRSAEDNKFAVSR
jgi:hypothetical protein